MVYKIRDSVDVYTIMDEILYFYFINTRQAYEFRVSQEAINLIALIDGKSSVEEIVQKYNACSEKGTTVQAVENTIAFLLKYNIVIPVEDENQLDTDDRYSRQINFLDELSLGTFSGRENQAKISKEFVAIFGIGAIGGDIAVLLAMAGVKKFILFDYKNVSESDLCRHMYYRRDYLGLPKVEALKKELQQINPRIQVQAICEQLTPQTEIEEIIRQVSFVVNAADEPYIGFTSLKISRMCVNQNKPHYIAGGFDIHVMSTGELIVPGITPCADCYAKHFKDKLGKWIPEPKKILDVHNEYGGFASHSLFSASFAVAQIIKYICGFIQEKGAWLTRGEMDIETYQIQYIDAVKDPNCPTCGGAANEASN